MSAVNFILQVEYPAKYYPEKDIEIEKEMGRRSDGGGYGFGIRDLSFCYARFAWAEKAASKLRRLHGVSAEVVEA